MTLKDDGKFCFECKEVGWLRKAHRIIPKHGAVCDEHYRHHEGLPQLTPEANALIARWKALKPKEVEVETKIETEGETQMRTSQPPEQSVIDAMRADFAAGMNVEQVRKKHHVSWPTAKKYCGNGHKAAKKNSLRGAL